MTSLQPGKASPPTPQLRQQLKKREAEVKDLQQENKRLKVAAARAGTQTAAPVKQLSPTAASRET
jgi:hypothetical protein